jgi:hypothetical protein
MAKAKAEFLRPDTFSGESAKGPYSFFSAIFFDAETKDQFKLGCTKEEQSALVANSVGKSGVVTFGVDKREKPYLISFQPG